MNVEDRRARMQRTIAFLETEEAIEVVGEELAAECVKILRRHVPEEESNQ